ncbi:homeodomain-like protein [Tanacetum coccineum]|uniref:Homeodomain-like protein n=1 Tax=Tanacetum coccineum TaxID=301880 RepID=A0ABQ5F245_9ASTR
MENSNDNGTVVAASNNMSNVGDHSVVSENPAVGPTQRALKHKIELSVNWSREEQSLLEELLARYASDTAILRYSKIALQLQDKTIRDVALRSRWMLNKEIKKKEIRKQIKDKSNSSRRHKEIKEKPVNQEADPSFHAESNDNGLPDAQPSTSMDNDDVISIAIGGVTGQLLDHINRAMDQVYANFSTFRENSDLLEIKSLAGDTFEDATYARQAQ